MKLLFILLSISCFVNEVNSADAPAEAAQAMTAEDYVKRILGQTAQDALRSAIEAKEHGIDLSQSGELKQFLIDKIVINNDDSLFWILVAGKTEINFSDSEELRNYFIQKIEFMSLGNPFTIIRIAEHSVMLHVDLSQSDSLKQFFLKKIQEASNNEYLSELMYAASIIKINFSTSEDFKQLFIEKIRQEEKLIQLCGFIIYAKNYNLLAVSLPVIEERILALLHTQSLENVLWFKKNLMDNNFYDLLSEEVKNRINKIASDALAQNIQIPNYIYIPFINMSNSNAGDQPSLNAYQAPQIHIPQPNEGAQNAAPQTSSRGLNFDFFNNLPDLDFQDLDFSNINQENYADSEVLYNQWTIEDDKNYVRSLSNVELSNPKRKAIANYISKMYKKNNKYVNIDGEAYKVNYDFIKTNAYGFTIDLPKDEVSEKDWKKILDGFGQTARDMNLSNTAGPDKPSNNPVDEWNEIKSTGMFHKGDDGVVKSDFRKYAKILYILRNNLKDTMFAALSGYGKCLDGALNSLLDYLMPQLSREDLREILKKNGIKVESSRLLENIQDTGLRKVATLLSEKLQTLKSEAVLKDIATENNDKEITEVSLFRKIVSFSFLGLPHPTSMNYEGVGSKPGSDLKSCLIRAYNSWTVNNMIKAVKRAFKVNVNHDLAPIGENNKETEFFANTGKVVDFCKEQLDIKDFKMEDYWKIFDNGEDISSIYFTKVNDDENMAFKGRLHVEPTDKFALKLLEKLKYIKKESKEVGDAPDSDKLNKLRGEIDKKVKTTKFYKAMDEQKKLIDSKQEKPKDDFDLLTQKRMDEVQKSKKDLLKKSKEEGNVPSSESDVGSWIRQRDQELMSRLPEGFGIDYIKRQYTYLNSNQNFAQGDSSDSREGIINEIAKITCNKAGSESIPCDTKKIIPAIKLVIESSFPEQKNIQDREPAQNQESPQNIQE